MFALVKARYTGADPGGGRALPPALDHQFFFQQTF